MITCGIDIKGSESIFVLLDSHGEVKSITERKITLGDSDSADSVQEFQSEMKEWLFKHHVDQICIKGRLKKGKFAGGPDSFKMEGIIQLMNFCDVKIVSPQALARFVKDQDQTMPEDILKYQENAYWAAKYYREME